MANLSRAKFRQVTELFPAVTEFFPSVTEPDGMAKSQPGKIPSLTEKPVTDGNNSVLDGAGRNNFRQVTELFPSPKCDDARTESSRPP